MAMELAAINDSTDAEPQSPSRQLEVPTDDFKRNEGECHEIKANASNALVNLDAQAWFFGLRPPAQGVDFVAIFFAGAFALVALLAAILNRIVGHWKRLSHAFRRSQQPQSIRGDGIDDNLELRRNSLSLARSSLKRAELVAPLVGLARALRDCYKRSGDLTLLDDQIQLYNEALQLLEDGDPRRPLVMCDMAEVLQRRSRARGHSNDLDRAVTFSRDALDLCPPKHSDRHRCLDEMGSALRARHRITGDPADMTLAITSIEEALRLRPVGHPDRHQSLSNLGSILTSRVSELGSKEQARTIVLLRESLELRPKAHIDRIVSLTNLGVSLFTRFNSDGSQTDLDECIEHYREALSIRGPGHPDYALCLSNLSFALVTRSRHLWEADDLDEAVSLLRESLRFLDISDTVRPFALVNLADTLQTRFHNFGGDHDLSDATQALQEALELWGPGSIPRRNVFQGLAAVSQLRYRNSRHLGDLDDSVSFSKQALDLYAPEHVERQGALRDLTQSLTLRFLAKGIVEDLDDAISAGEEALQQSGEDTPFRALTHFELGKAYRHRFRYRHHPDDISAAMDNQLKALACCPAGRASRSEVLFEIARLLLTKKSPTFDLLKGLQHLSEAIDDTHCNAQTRLTEGVKILEELRSGLEDATLSVETRTLLLAVHRRLVKLLPRVAYFGLDIKSRLQALGESGKLTNWASGHALCLQQPHVAIELLEEGRGIFWTQALRLRTPFDELPKDLSKRLVALSHQLERDSHIVPDPKNLPGDEASQRRRQGAEFDKLVDQARSINGLKNFMFPDSVDDLRWAAREGPVVILVADEDICWAVILVAPDADIRQLSLPEVSSSRLMKLGLVVREASMRSAEENNGERMGMKVVGAVKTHDEDILRDLWTAVVKPVISALGLEKSVGRHRPRLWWCPTGPFSFLPLHAAGLYGRTVDCTSDYLVSSYIPTLSALLNARRGLKDVLSEEPRVLLAAVPRPPNEGSLPFAQEEVESVKRILPARTLMPLSPSGGHANQTGDESINVQTIVEILPEASVLHLACHGHQVLGDALQSGFVMQDGMLNVAELMKLNLPRASFAFLSACETAKGDQKVPDQMVHLAAAMMFAGFRSVVGTMWSMGDRDGPAIADSVYSQLLRDGRVDLVSIPYALDDAVQKLRDQGVPVNRWATYIHLGA